MGHKWGELPWGTPGDGGGRLPLVVVLQHLGTGRASWWRWWRGENHVGVGQQARPPRPEPRWVGWAPLLPAPLRPRSPLHQEGLGLAPPSRYAPQLACSFTTVTIPWPGDGGGHPCSAVRVSGQIPGSLPDPFPPQGLHSHGDSRGAGTRGRVLARFSEHPHPCLPFGDGPGAPGHRAQRGSEEASLPRLPGGLTLLSPSMTT